MDARLRARLVDKKYRLGSTRHDNDRHNSFRGKSEVACTLTGQADGSSAGERNLGQLQTRMNKGRARFKMKMVSKTGRSNYGRGFYTKAYVRVSLPG
jgi:hypothetical protein